MEGTSIETLPPLKSSALSMDIKSPIKVAIDTEAMTLPPLVVLDSSDKFPTTSFKKQTVRRLSLARPSFTPRRLSLAPSRTEPDGAPEVFKKIFTGQLSQTYFDELCYGKRKESLREFQYKAPNLEREVPLWEPKQLRRAEARHKIRNIQDARFRKQDRLEEESARKSAALSRKTAHCLLTQAEIMPQGKLAFLEKVDKDKSIYKSRCMANKKTREKMIELERTERRFSII